MQLADLIEGYSVGKLLSDGETSSVHEGTRQSDGLPVLLKVHHRAGTGREWARQEFDAIRACRHPRAVKAIELLEGEVPVLVLERLPGRTLRSWIREDRLSLEQVLDVAIDVADVLEAVHAARLVHRDVTPANVLVDLEARASYLIDFGIALPLGMASGPATEGKTWVEGTLPYLAPEQTGWVNHGLDCRTDLYNLGATLYHGLTGRPPFTERDANRLMHAHVAREPEPVHVSQPEIPVALSRVVSKLLKKEPAQRYGSARSLRVDLEQLRDALVRNGSMPDDFEPGGHDVPDRPRFATALYGRRREIERLQTACRERSSGPPRILLLRGRTGAGKTALLDALRPSIAEAGGYLAAGRFNVSADQPYAGWIAALRALTAQILIESEDSFQSWRETLRKGLGNVAGALMELVPDLAVLLPDTTPVPELAPRQTRERLAVAFERLIRACSARAHLLVILLDDLQWCDAGSRFLLERLLNATGFHSLLLIGTFRKEELTPDHPLSVLLDERGQQSAAVEVVELPPLDAESAEQMLAEALGQDEPAVHELAERVRRATDNTPLLIREFVDHLHAQGLLRYEGGRWTWHQASVEAASVPDGVVALMTAKIDRLPPETQHLLEIASCMASEFDRTDLREISDYEPVALDAALLDLTDAGLWIPSPGGFRFAHDRLRQAGQERGSEQTRAMLHLRIGRALLERSPDAASSSRVFEIADHLNRAGAELPEALRMTLIELNARAGERALRSGAGADAAAYLECAHHRLRLEDWESQRPLVLQLYLHWVESLVQTGELERALGVLDDLDRRSPSRIEFTQIAAKRIYIYAMIRRPYESVRYTLSVLRRLGIRWPLHPSFLRTRLALLRVRWRLRGRRLEDVLQRDLSPDLNRLAPLMIFQISAAVMSRYDARLSALTTSVTMHHLLRHGYLQSPCQAAAALAIFSHAFLPGDPYAHAYAESTLGFVESVPDPIRGPRAELQIHGLLRPWSTRRRRALPHLERLSRELTEAGDPEWDYYARFLHALYRALAGDPVKEVEAELEHVVDDMQRTGNEYPDSGQLLRPYRLLSVAQLEPERLDREATEYGRWAAASLGGSEPMIRTLWMLVACIYRRFDLAFAQSEAVIGRLFYQVPFVHQADHMLYRGLAASHLASASRGRARRRFLRILRQARERLHDWARQGADFRHMALLLDAEHARLRDQPLRALQLYRDAASGATDQNFPHHVAFAHEQRGRLLVQVGRSPEASRVLADAVQLYESWGACAKAASLELERGELAGPHLAAPFRQGPRH